MHIIQTSHCNWRRNRWGFDLLFKHAQGDNSPITVLEGFSDISFVRDLQAPGRHGGSTMFYATGLLFFRCFLVVSSWWKLTLQTAVYEVGRNGVRTPLVSGWNSTTLSYPFICRPFFIGAPNVTPFWGKPYSIHNEGKLLKCNRCWNDSASKFQVCLQKQWEKLSIKKKTQALKKIWASRFFWGAFCRSTVSRFCGWNPSVHNASSSWTIFIYVHAFSTH